MGGASKDEAILRAIRENRCLMLNYRDYSRVVEPYLLGSDAAGAKVLCAYQLSGGDEAHVTFGWKLFDLAGIRGAAVVSGRFAGDRPLPEELALSAIAARVSADPALAMPPDAAERRAVPRHTG